MPNERTGHVDWSHWSFDYEVSDSEGLSLLNGSYRGRGVIGKFSLPVIRVKYLRDGGPFGLDRRDTGGILGAFFGGLFGGGLGAFLGYLLGREVAGDGAGPFADQISWDLGGDHGLQRISDRNDEYIGLLEYTQGDTNWLEISIYARIGAYHLYQAWHLSETGTILPRIWSKGLHINMDHTHHPYWRLDFDIDGTEHNRVYLRDNHSEEPGRPPGTYRGWWYYPKEANDIKLRLTYRPSSAPNPSNVIAFSRDRVWFVRNEKTGRGAWITPGPDDGSPDDFSRIDMAVRLYHKSEEDNPWPFGVNGLGFLDDEDVGDSDVVFWYVAHMFHRGAEGSDHWHSGGPMIQLEGYELD